LRNCRNFGGLWSSGCFRKKVKHRNPSLKIFVKLRTHPFAVHHQDQAETGCQTPHSSYPGIFRPAHGMISLFNERILLFPDKIVGEHSHHLAWIFHAGLIEISLACAIGNSYGFGSDGVVPGVFSDKNRPQNTVWRHSAEADELFSLQTMSEIPQSERKLHACTW